MIHLLDLFVYDTFDTIVLLTYTITCMYTRFSAVFFLFNLVSWILTYVSDLGPVGNKIRLVSIPDGLGPEEDRNDLGKLTGSISQVMPGKLEELIGEINGLEDDEVTCILSDISFVWTFQVAGKMKIPTIGFWPASSALLVLALSVPKLIDDGVLNQDGKYISLVTWNFL